MDSRYIKRVNDNVLASRLKRAAAVLIVGAKSCGKTECARRLAKNELLLDVDANTRELLQAHVMDVLDSEKPLLIDEWQLAPPVWNMARRYADNARQKGLFILTGSATPADDITRHSGAGRFSRIRMRPLSLFESGYSNGSLSLSSLMAGNRPLSPAPDPGYSFTDIASFVCRGGWPASATLALDEAIEANMDYVEELIHVDISKLDEVKRSPDKVRLSLEAIARNVSTPVSNKTLLLDMDNAFDGMGISEPTLIAYLNALERLMILEPLFNWSVRMRSKTGLRRSPHLHFVDPSLACAVLRTQTQDLMNDLGALGLLFESLVIRDLRIYSQEARGEVRFFANYDDDEIDAIITYGNKRWAACEIKLNPEKAPAAAENLNRIIRKIDTDHAGEPAFKAVITGFGNYRELDGGVLQIPIGCLGA
jgi:predicted AAA+ superfamily ATPase